MRPISGRIAATGQPKASFPGRPGIVGWRAKKGPPAGFEPGASRPEDRRLIRSKQEQLKKTPFFRENLDFPEKPLFPGIRQKVEIPGRFAEKVAIAVKQRAFGRARGSTSKLTDPARKTAKSGNPNNGYRISPAGSPNRGRRR